MYNKNNLLPLKMVSKVNFKPELASVAFYGNRTIGTDSFRLLEVTTPKREDGEEELSHDPKLIHKDNLKSVKLKKDETRDFEELVKESTAVNPAVMTEPYRNYPDVDVLMNEDPDQEYATVKVDGKLLGEMLTAMASMNPFGQVELRVPVDSPYKPIRIKAINHKTDQTARALVMSHNK